MAGTALVRGRRRGSSKTCSLELHALYAKQLLARGWIGYVRRVRKVHDVLVCRMLTERAVGLLPVQSLMGGAVVLMDQCTMTLPWGVGQGQGR